MTNIGTEVLEILLRILNEIEPAMQLVIKVLNWVAEFLDKYGEQLGQTIWNSLESLPLIGHIFTAIKGILKIMQLWSDEQEEEAPKDPIFEIFLETTKAARRRMDPIGEGLGG
jgi:isocitrate/isopropylmalate dehydrogenase